MSTDTATHEPRLKQRYRDEAVEALKDRLGRANRMAVPCLVKVCLNMGLGRALEDKKIFEQAVGDLTLIGGQKAVLTKARKSISNFKLRQGYNIGARVTLRGRWMFEFLYRLISVTLPRVPDFRGLNPNSFDGRGNYSMGLQEILAFPEIDPDKSTYPMGLHITVVTTAKSDEEGFELLKTLGFPFAVKAAEAGAPAKG